MKKQIKEEKQEQKPEGDYNQVLSDIQEGDYRLKKTETNEANIAKKSKKRASCLN